ncbi:MAG: hypothetical protein AB8G15_04590 [Saprospiraceae bacterium]
MKKILLSLFTVFLVSGVFAQKQDQTATEQNRATEKYRAMFQLNDEQGREMAKIVARHTRNSQEIQSLKAADPQQFLKKRKSIDMGMNNSIRMILNKDQLKVYREQQIELRKKRAYKELEMRENKASQREVEVAIAELYLIQ